MPPIADLGRWWAALLFGLMLLLLLLIASWLLRAVVPVAPAVTLSAMETPALSAAARPSDPMPALRTSLNDAQAGPAVKFAQVMRDQLVASGIATSTYRGSDGLYGRADLAGLNLAQHPSILIELGNMKNADEAVQMRSPEGRAKYSAAVAQGIADYLGQK